MAYDFKQLCILVAEDSQPMRDLTTSILKTFEVGSIVAASDGRQAFDKFCQFKPDVVISDWMMNPVTGIELAQKIRKDKRSPNPFVPFILMTGFSEKKRVITARDSGITEFLAKPFTVRDLYKRLELIIERPRQFVQSDDFFGPDRRRKRESGYQGPYKRETDVVGDDAMYVNTTGNQ